MFEENWLGTEMEQEECLVFQNEDTKLCWLILIIFLGGKKLVMFEFMIKTAVLGIFQIYLLYFTPYIVFCNFKI